jgi:hypothetical protein
MCYVHLVEVERQTLLMHRHIAALCWRTVPVGALVNKATNLRIP